MKVLIILALAVAASAFPQREPEPLNIGVPVNDDIDGRITNGKAAAVGQFPYQVALTMKISMLSSSSCGGSLITNNFVLTAAHCTESAQSVTVLLGVTVRTSPDVSHTVPSSDIYIHPGWNSKTLANDVSLIRIPATASTSNIKPIPFARTCESYIGMAVVASGFGRTTDSNNLGSTQLLYADMTVADNSRCNIYSVFNPETTICVGTADLKSTCNGDSGGPLALVSRYLLIGSTSYGASAGCEKGHPVVFAKLCSFSDWIDSIIAK